MSTVEEKTSSSTTAASSARQSLAGAAVILLTCIVVVSLPLLVFGIVSTYGTGDASAGWDPTTVALLSGYAVASGLLVAWSIRWIARMLGRTGPSVWMVAPLAAALAFAAPFAAGWAGQQIWERDQQVIDAACSAQDVADVQQMQPYGIEFAPATGDPSGLCSGWIMRPGDDAPAVMQALWVRMAEDGWTTTDTDTFERTWTRGDVTVRVWHIQSSDGTTGVGIEPVG